MERSKVEEIISLYQEHENLKIVGTLLGIPWQTVYWWLKKEGVSVKGNKAKYGSESDRIGLIGESLFKKSVPTLIDQNDLQFQAKYDFKLGDLKVDVKTGFLKEDKTTAKPCYRWALGVRSQPEADYIVGYLLEGDISNYKVAHIILIPNEFFKELTTISIPKSYKGKWIDFFITEEELVEFFKSVVEV